MKALTVILAIMVTLLSVIPCCPDNSCSAVDKVATEQRDSQEGDAEACSPFYSCATCIGFTLSSSSIEPATVPTNLNNPVAVYAQRCFPQPHYSIWQPPKVC